MDGLDPPARSLFTDFFAADGFKYGRTRLFTDLGSIIATVVCLRGSSDSIAPPLTRLSLLQLLHDASQCGYEKVEAAHVRSGEVRRTRSQPVSQGEILGLSETGFCGRS